ncbi:hypothetical protein Hanom_Chr05g00405791 [Helianthus anomalus]
MTLKRGCYIDENMNPLDFVKIFCTGTYKMEDEKIQKNEASMKFGSSTSECVCSKCDKSEGDNVTPPKETTHGKPY